jgi:hypothetical protein
MADNTPPVDTIEYNEGDGKILFEAFEKLDLTGGYIPWDKMAPWQRQNWEDIAKEFLTNI